MQSELPDSTLRGRSSAPLAMSVEGARERQSAIRDALVRPIGTDMSQNTLIHGLVRPAVRAVAAHTGLTPNHLTTLRLTTGLAAAMIFAQGTYGWVSIIGGLIFLLSMLLDRADGELARHTNQMSVAGHRYDLVSDCIVGICTFIGIGIGVAHTAGQNALWLGALAGLGIGVLFLELNLMSRFGEGTRPVRWPRK